MSKDIKAFCQPDSKGFFGAYGGQYVPDAIKARLDELDQAFKEALADPEFTREMQRLLLHFAGRPSPVFHCRNLSKKLGGAQIWLKREDLNHLGAHKVNNTIGQCLLAKRMGKTRVIAETGAGQHGVGTAASAALMGLECVICMGEVDVVRQHLNVTRMEMLGARVHTAMSGQRTLKEAVDEALEMWVNEPETFYVLGSAVGPHPYPLMVRHFQSVIGSEARAQMLEFAGRLPDVAMACVGGGSNAIGVMNAFLDDERVNLYGYEAGGNGPESGKHATRFAPGTGQLGMFQGAKSYLLETDEGQTLDTYSISAGLDYASVGPEHAWLKDIGRVNYSWATDEEAMNAFRDLSQTEGIIPAIESSHAVEIGLPYSDPVMDGPVIQAAASIALNNGETIKRVFEAVETVANAGGVPLIMSYWNLVYHYGVERFARDFENAGGAGLITPDLIPDEAGEWIEASDRHGLDRIFLVSPDSSTERLETVARNARGFVYAAARMGVTGERATIDASPELLVERTRQAGAENVCVGIGVSTAEQGAKVGSYADGVIVGSALVHTLLADDNKTARDPKEGLKLLAAKSEELAEGIHNAR